MPNQKNIDQVAEIRDRLSSAATVVLTDFQGLTVAEVGYLRDKLREVGVQYKVFKNKLISVAAKEIAIEGLEPYLIGTTALATSDEPASVAKVLIEFGEENENLKIKGAILGTKVIDAESAKELTKMPSRDELIARVVGGLNAQISGLVRTLHASNKVGDLANVLSGTIRQLATVVQAIADQNENSASH